MSVYLTLGDIAAECHVSKARVRGWLRAGLKWSRPGLQKIVHVDDLRAWVDALPCPPRASAVTDGRVARAAANTDAVAAKIERVIALGHVFDDASSVSARTLIAMCDVSRRVGARAIDALIARGVLVRTPDGRLASAPAPRSRYANLGVAS